MEPENKAAVSVNKIPTSSIPRAPYRHAEPSGPWPWQNLDDPIPEEKEPDPKHTHEDSVSEPCKACHWKYYPESLFPNWLKDQVKRSKMKDLPKKNSTIYRIDVLSDGTFQSAGQPSELVYAADPATLEAAFEKAIEAADGVRLSAFFVENLSTPVMQLIGNKFIVEPFFWTSSVNWIPSRYQENPVPKRGDHITIVLKFPRSLLVENKPSQMPQDHSTAKDSKPKPTELEEIIDTQKPLRLSMPENTKFKKEPNATCNAIITDILAIHMVRSVEGSTLITYHPEETWCTTTAENLRTRTFLAGQSVYWNIMFRETGDPTLVLLATLWYALYAWDEAFDTLWEHICQLELQVIGTNDMRLTQELHKIRAHLLHYASLLDDFIQTVEFVQETINPAMEIESEAYRDNSNKLLARECAHLREQINRLQTSREMWDKRLQNVMHLVFSKVTIEDSDQMKNLTQASLRDSAAMKQISYLTMVFFPATFMASIFGMNVKEINPDSYGTLSKYFATTIPLTIVTTWVIMAFQLRWREEHKRDKIRMWERLMWPYDYARSLFPQRKSVTGDEKSEVSTVVETPSRQSV